uniref:hypothetical protein n=1 Tax=Enterocloster clostridioformis TaxID=1531 RepID=UPI002ECFD633
MAGAIRAAEDQQSIPHPLHQFSDPEQLSYGGHLPPLHSGQTLPALSVIEELSEIQCCYFCIKEELSTLFATGQLLQMVVFADIRRNRFYSVPESGIVFKCFIKEQLLGLGPAGHRSRCMHHLPP